MNRNLEEFLVLYGESDITTGRLGVASHAEEIGRAAVFSMA